MIASLSKALRSHKRNANFQIKPQNSVISTFKVTGVQVTVEMLTEICILTTLDF